MTKSLTLSLYLVLASIAVAGKLEDKLTQVAGKGQAYIVGELLAKGADLNVKDSDGLSALNWAAYKGNVVVAEIYEKLGQRGKATVDYRAYAAT